MRFFLDRTAARRQTWSQRQALWCIIDTLPFLNKLGEWWTLNHNKMPIYRQREKILMTSFLHLLHLPALHHPSPPVLFSFLSSVSSSPPSVCSRRLPLTAGDAAAQRALTASSPGLGGWVPLWQVLSCLATSPRWWGCQRLLGYKREKKHLPVT